MLKEIFRGILITLIIGFIVVVIGIWALPSFISQQEAKNFVAQTVRLITGNEQVEVKGAVTLSTLPSPTLQATNIVIGQGKNADHIPTLVVKADSWKLLQNHLSIALEALVNSHALRAKLDIQDITHIQSQNALDFSLKTLSPYETELNGKIAFSETEKVINPLSIVTERSSGKGKIKLAANPSNTGDHITADFVFDTLDLNEIFGATAIVQHMQNNQSGNITEEVKKTHEKNSAEAKDVNVKEKSPIALDVDVKLNIKKLMLDNELYGKSTISLHKKGQQVTARLTSDGLGGKADINAGLTLHKTGAISAVNTKITLAPVDIGYLLKLGGFDRLQGKGDVTLSLSSKGKEPQALIRNLQGSGKVHAENLVLRGVDITALANTSPEAITQAINAKKGTKIELLDASFTIKDGVLQNDDLQAKVPFSSLKGEGKIDLAKQTINYLITPSIAKKQLGLQVPLKIKGDLHSPKIVPDLKNIVIENLKDKDVINKLKEQDVIKNLKENKFIKDNPALQKLLSPQK